jgi:hypothetical protein
MGTVKTEYLLKQRYAVWIQDWGKRKDLRHAAHHASEKHYRRYTTQSRRNTKLFAAENFERSSQQTALSLTNALAAGKLGVTFEQPDLLHLEFIKNMSSARILEEQILSSTYPWTLLIGS